MYLKYVVGIIHNAVGYYSYLYVARASSVAKVQRSLFGPYSSYMIFVVFVKSHQYPSQSTPSALVPPVSPNAHSPNRFRGALLS